MENLEGTENLLFFNAYRNYEKKKRERRVKKARELMVKAENAPAEEKLKLLKEARKLVINVDRELTIKAERLDWINKVRNPAGEGRKRPLG